MASSSPEKTRDLGEDGLGAQQLSETTTGAVVTAPLHQPSHRSGQPQGGSHLDADPHVGGGWSIRSTIAHLTLVKRAADSEGGSLQGFLRLGVLGQQTRRRCKTAWSVPRREAYLLSPADPPALASTPASGGCGVRGGVDRVGPAQQLGLHAVHLIA